MALLGNIIWIICGGFAIFLEYIAAGLILCCTIVGIPAGIQVMKLSILGLMPFGMEVEDTDSPVTGIIALFLNIIWFFVGGIWLMLTHALFGLALAITIIGLPFAKQHFKLAGLAMAPFGKSLRRVE